MYIFLLQVEYCAEGFLDKNRDSLPETVQAVLKFSGLRLVRALFTNYPNFKGSVLRSASRIRPRYELLYNTSSEVFLMEAMEI